MTPDEAFERELRSYRTPPPSSRLRRRIGNQLARPSRPSRRWLGAAVAAAVAAVLAVDLATRRPPIPSFDWPPAAKANVPPPSVQAYNRALAESPAGLDALLDAQSVRASRDVSPIPPARVGFVSNLLAITGSRE